MVPALTASAAPSAAFAAPLPTTTKSPLLLSTLGSMDPAPTRVDLRNFTLATWHAVQAKRALQQDGAANSKAGSAAPLVDGATLSVGDVVAVSRYAATPELDNSPEVRRRVQASIDVLDRMLKSGESVYGVATGFGGSADTRTTQFAALQISLVSGLQIGILPVPGHVDASGALPLSDEPLSQPEAWVRGAMVVRLNSLVRGHSGVRFVVLETMHKMLKYNITPVVPLRSSISASGDLSPLSYIAGAMAGMPGVYVWVDGPDGRRMKMSSPEALAKFHIEPLSYEPKEGLGLVNGTAYSAAVGALVMHESNMLALLTQLTTALAVEADLASDGSFAAFIHNEARPHPGQIEAGATVLAMLRGSKLATHVENEVHADDDGVLRQDRYPLRCSPQWMGPLLEDLLAASRSITIELNSTTDNPLCDARTGHIAHQGNFMASAVTSAMEKTRLALALLGKMTFQQMTELINPAMNRGLPANLAATDVSLDYFGKSCDIAMAAVTSELQYLASPVSTHVQAAEMGNQAINSMALVSARYTVKAIETFSQLLSWTLYLLCQAVDLRAMQRQTGELVRVQLKDSLASFFGKWLDEAEQALLAKRVFARISRRFDETGALVLQSRMHESYLQGADELSTYFAELPSSAGNGEVLRTIMAWRKHSVAEMCERHHALTAEFLADANGTPATPYLAPTTGVMYTYVRQTLGVPLAGREHFAGFKGAAGQLGENNGAQVSKIYRAIRSGELYTVLVDIASTLPQHA
ncbi:putative phenylalanine ammonia-lyase [Tilletiopsis washingtonensis]|uniref:Putative phenylalanine ammonia-lyase n=1 Tax=Tilletiopsis washingtonensis TaxID=58919 RepID=A0A316ZCM0_9BASI|nr:putative phenylalanine ammonia-lyase [Tilletiopsis washingtonensis]PWN99527.1 putative phenylalanine ammonia-lyase [Tilletiopsis washingtonensis]